MTKYNSVAKRKKPVRPTHTYAYDEGKWQMVEGAVWSSKKQQYWVTFWGNVRKWVEFPYVVFQLTLFDDNDVESPQS